MGKNYNDKMIRQIEQEINNIYNEAKSLNDSECMVREKKIIPKDKVDKYDNLFCMLKTLNFGELYDDQVYLFGDIVIPINKYDEFMEKLHDKDTGITIPAALAQYGKIPGYNIPAPMCTPDNKTVDEMEMLYISYYAQFGIYPTYDKDGIRERLPHEKFMWTDKGPVLGGDDYAPPYYRRYVKEWKAKKANIQQQNANNSKTQTPTSSRPKAQKGSTYQITKRCQAVGDQLNRILYSAKVKCSMFAHTKNGKRTLIICGVLAAVGGVPTLVTSLSHVALFGLSPLFTLAAVDIAVTVGLIKIAVEKHKKFMADNNLKTFKEKRLEKKQEREQKRKQRKINKLRAQLEENENSIKEIDRQINVLNNNTNGLNPKTVNDILMELLDKKEKLKQIRQDITDALTAATMVPNQQQQQPQQQQSQQQSNSNGMGGHTR